MNSQIIHQATVISLLTITLPLFTISLSLCVSGPDLPEIVPFNRYPPETIQEIAAFLPEKPTGMGKPITDRKFWDEKRKDPAFHEVIPRAENYLEQELPEITDELYLDYSKTGNRVNWEKVSFNRRGRIRWYTLAECLENKGRFLPALKELVLSVCKEKTWVMPAHDGDLANYKGKKVDIDLGSAMLAWDLGTAWYLLNPVLDNTLARKIQLEIRTRVLNPYIKMLTGRVKENWWLTTTNNWNAVCLAGVTGAALATIPEKGERASFVRAADEYIENFLNGFSKDGYCSEGLGYWNYGFGHFLMLAETIYQATGGNVDFFTKEKARVPALFAERIRIINTIYPAFADCRVDESPSPLAMFHVQQRFAPDLESWKTCNPVASASHLYETAIYSLSFPGCTGFPGTTSPASLLSHTLRDWFENAGILICRPGPGTGSLIGAAIKGGHNDEHHNHNDAGSFVVVAGNTPVIFDPGSEVYTARTFSSHRYESNLLNSYGHSVPVVAGKLQKTGAEAKATIVLTDFSDTKDTLILDLTSAYSVSCLSALTRTFVYSRENQGSVTITDKVRLTAKKTFGTALIIPGAYERMGDSLLIFTLKGAVKVFIDTQEARFSINKDIIQEQSLSGIKPTRIGINLEEPVKEASIRIHITPAVVPDFGKGIFLNGGFEYSSMGWSLGENCMAYLSAEKSASGDYSIKIEDKNGTAGTNILSDPVDCLGKTSCAISGKYYPVSGNGFGVYIRFYNKIGEMINQVNEKGWVDPVGILGGDENIWKDFSFSFIIPEQTYTLRIWLHSFNQAKVTGYIDDLILLFEK